MKKVLSFLLVTLILVEALAICAGAANTAYFPDVPTSHWAYYYISEMQKYNIINGYDDGLFRPEEKVRTGEFIKMLSMALGTDRVEMYTATHWSEPYVIAFGKGVDISSYTALELDSTITREDAVVLATKYYMAERGMVRSSCVGSYVMRFYDNDKISSSARKYIDMAVEYGIINGFDDGAFNPQSGLTRAQAAKIIYIAMTAVPPYEIVSHAEVKYFLTGKVITETGDINSDYIYNDGVYVKTGKLVSALKFIGKLCDTQDVIGAGFMVNLFRRTNGLEYGGYYMLFAPSDDCYIENGKNSIGLERVCDYSRKAADELGCDVLCIVFGSSAGGTYEKFYILNGEVIRTVGDTGKTAKDASNLLALAPDRVSSIANAWLDQMRSSGRLSEILGNSFSGNGLDWEINSFFTADPDICHVVILIPELSARIKAGGNSAELEESIEGLCRLISAELTAKYYWSGTVVTYCTDKESHIPVIVMSDDDVFKYDKQ